MIAQQKPLAYALAIIINHNNEILLTYRINTPWFNNYYGFVGGKIENKESGSQAIIREIYEEIGLTIYLEDVLFAHVMHFMGESHPCIAFFYIIRKWTGIVTNKEPHKNKILTWFQIDNLPTNIIPRHEKALELIQKDITYSEDNWPLDY